MIEIDLNYFGFSFGPARCDGTRKRLVEAFDRFIEVDDFSDLEVAKMSRELAIDIAIDLNGFTRGVRAEIFSYGAVPIQVNYLGYPGTMGASYMDYIIADKTLIPFDFRSHYSEKVVFLQTLIKRMIERGLFQRGNLQDVS